MTKDKTMPEHTDHNFYPDEIYVSNQEGVMIVEEGLEQFGNVQYVRVDIRTPEPSEMAEVLAEALRRIAEDDASTWPCCSSRLVARYALDAYNAMKGATNEQ